MKGHRIFAALYDVVESPARRSLGPIRQFIAGGARGLVLEVGCGTGGNFPYYDFDVIERLEATEPDPFMLRRAKERVAKLGLYGRVRLLEAPAEELPFEDGSFDTVVASLVLCSVEDLDKSLAEIRRVLKQDGMLRIVEHVRAEGWMGRVQDVVEPVWGYFSAGCHPNRRTAEAVRAAGFVLDVERQFNAGPGVPAFVGVARPSDSGS